MKPPCKNCPDRSTACHDTCERYQAYNKHRQGIRDARAKENYLQDYFWKPQSKSERQRRLHG